MLRSGSCWMLVASCAASGGGVWVYRLDGTNGVLEALGRAEGMASALFVTADAGGRRVYAVGDAPGIGPGAASGVAAAFDLDPATGRLAFLGAQPTLGSDTCYVDVAPGGRAIFATNYRASLDDRGMGRGSVAVLPVGPDGRLGAATQRIEHAGASAHPRRQTASHPHSVTVTPEGRYAVVADLGTDEVVIYPIGTGSGGEATLNEAGAVRERVAPEQGPRHLAFAPGGRTAFLLTEMGSCLVAQRWDPDGPGLAEIDSVPLLPEGWTGHNDAADVHVHPSGRWVYASNRGHDSIAVAEVDPDTGGLTGAVRHVPCGGRTPRGFGLDPSGRWMIVANQASGNLVVLRLDEETGMPEATGTCVAAEGAVCVRCLRPKT